MSRRLFRAASRRLATDSETGSHRRALDRRQIVAFAAVLGLVALASVTSIAQSRATPSKANANGPLRAIFYLTAPVHSGTASSGQPIPGGPMGVQAHLAALKWAWADAAIIPWSTPGSAADRRVATVLSAITKTQAHVRVAALIDRPGGSELSQLRSLALTRATARGYLRVSSRPAVFVAPADRSLRSCLRARRWRAAGRAFWLAQATFAGYGRCREAADAWFRDDPNLRSTRTSSTFLIRPGVWPSGVSKPSVARAGDEWQRSIEQMNGSGSPVQLIDSLNDWAVGSAIEPSSAWPSASGFGSYLDELHAQQPGVATLATAPDIGAITISGVTAHEASLATTISAGSSAAAWRIEFGTTTEYGQTTAPIAVPAASSHRPVAVVLPALTAATTYHARIVVTSSVGTVVSSDAAFKTLPDVHAYRIAAAGDIACDPASAPFNGGLGTATACHQQGVSDALLAGGYDAVLPLGDLQYENGAASAFQASYQPSWGRLKAITHPAVGNHEYGSPGATPYFQYFGPAAGDPGKGYYSYELGSWHLIAINSNCTQIGGCAAGSPEELWLRADLAAHPARCTLAYWHHPRFSSGQAGDNGLMSAIWTDLSNAGAELVLSGHEHDYERFAAQNAEGERDDARGVRQFVVGTGGKNHMMFKTIKPNSEVRDTSSFGFLQLTLNADSYSWTFVSDPPGGLSDSGTGTCH